MDHDPPFEVRATPEARRHLDRLPEKVVHAALTRPGRGDHHDRVRERPDYTYTMTVNDPGGSIQRTATLAVG